MERRGRGERGRVERDEKRVREEIGKRGKESEGGDW